MRAFAPFLFAICLSVACFCQTPVSDGTGTQGITDTSLWAICSNPAQLLGRRGGFVAGARNSYFVGVLNRYRSGVSIPVRKQIIAIDVAYSGVQFWNEKRGGIAVASRLFRTASVAGKLEYLRISHSTIAESDAYFYPKLYATTNISPQLRISAVANGFYAIYGNSLQSVDPPVCLGVLYRVNTHFAAVYELYYATIGALQNRLGAEYAPVEPVAFRFGLGSGETPVSAGVGVNYGQGGLDIAARYNRYLGVSLSAGIRWSL